MGHDTHELFSEMWRNVIARQLELLLDKYSSEKEVISIDKLEIDLEEMQEELLEEELSMKVKEVLEEKLLQVINAARISSSPEVYDGNDRTTVTFRSTKTSRLELLVHFLQTGTMPWWARNEETSVSLLFETLLQEEPVQLRTELTRLLGKSNPRKRFIYQLPGRTIASVMSLFGTSFITFAQDIVNVVEDTRSAGLIGVHASSTLRTITWEYFITAAVTGNTGASEKEKEEHIVALAERLLFFDPAKLRAIANHVKAKSQLTGELKELFETAAEMARTAAEKEKQENHKEDKEEERDQADREKEKARNKRDDVKDREQADREEEKAKKRKDDAKNREKADDEEKRTKSRRDADEDEDIDPGKNEKRKDERSAGKQESSTPGNNQPDDQLTNNRGKEDIAEKLRKLFGDKEKSSDDLTAVLSDGLYINNAGLVLLWPYLGAFFNHLGLMNGNQFTNEEAAHRAAHLLQYLATASEDAAEEHELVLNKLLCGLPVEDPISKDFTITEGEKTECENLLNAVVSNWSALKRSSSQALRNTFLVKEGLLTKESDWSLKIERQSIDMLIDRLPWSISIIKLPWCSEMLYVEW